MIRVRPVAFGVVVSRRATAVLFAEYNRERAAISCRPRIGHSDGVPVRLDSIFQDVRYAVRTIGRAPLFAAIVAATMGLALGLVGSANETLMTSQLLETSFSWMLPEPLSKLCQ